jgi:hypothetical protein
MTRSRRSAATPLAAKAVELYVAAPQVVAHRVARMARAGGAPSARDRREFARMGSEKVTAFYQSWAAMWTQALQAQWQLAQAWAAVPMQLAAGRRAPLRAPLAKSRRAVAGVLSAGLAPVHSKALANARRLSRRKR